jgi:uncharacterized protein with HEPN domain
LALVKCVEIIGEAAAHLTPQFQNEHPEIPWPAIIGMRNRLIHGYFEIDMDRLWDTVTKNIPELLRLLDGVAS